MRSALAQAAIAANRVQRRQRSTSLSTVPPAATSDDYHPELAAIAASIVYRSPLPSKEGRPIYIFNGAAFPDAYECDYDSLLSYVLSRLPDEDELLSGTEYEIIFFAGGQPDNATSEKKQGPGIGWYLEAYNSLHRATRKRLQKLYIVHPRTWVRVLVGVFGTIVSPKFRRKIVHVNTLSQLALHIPMEKLLIPPNVYLHDRKLEPDIYVPFATGRRAFGVRHPFPRELDTGRSRLPRVLRETTSFLMSPACIRMEGLFRIPPNAILSSALKEAYDRGQYFIVWKEKGATVVQPGVDPTLVDEIRLEDAYGVYLAASLIKQWYADLRDPIIPESAYDTLRQRFGDTGVRIEPEDLVELILPASELSPLSRTSRKIMIRHLLPLLSEIAAHEAENKMSPEALAVCFSICLICGSNQLEDAKMASIVKRMLQAAIEMWPELRAGMGLTRESFLENLQAPADSRDYEDPLEEELPPRTERRSGNSSGPKYDEHRITMEDSETGVIEHQTTSTSRQRSGNNDARERAPTLPPRPIILTDESTPAVAQRTNGAPAVPKRKPAPTAVEPPRYSVLYGNDAQVADSPASYAPPDGFGPPRHGPWSYDEKKGLVPETIDPAAATHMPKRKAVHSELKPPESIPDLISDTSTTASIASDDTAIVDQHVQKAAAALATQAAAALAEKSETNPTFQSPENLSNTITSKSSSTDDHVFRKPSWPASSRPIIQPQSLAKPVIPQRQTQTYPIPSIPSTSGNSNSSLTTPPISGVPRVRAPSPGLLKRMSSMEAGSTPTGAQQQEGAALGPPRKLDMRKASVEDLRRLYEERVSVTEGLAKVEKARRGSTT